MSLRYNPKKLPVLKKDQPKKVRNTKPVEKLQPLVQNIKIDEQFASKSVIDAIDRIISAQWNIIPTQLNSGFQEHIKKYRNFLPNVVSRYQLYSILHKNQTFIDQEIENLYEDQMIKRFILQDNDDLNDLIMKKEDYDTFLQNIYEKSDNSIKDCIDGLRVFISGNHRSLKFPRELILQKMTEDQLSFLIKLNLVQIMPQSTKGLLKFSIPRYGYVLNLYQNSKKFALKNFNKTWKEVKHNELYDKWEKNKSKFKDFKGLNLNWILHWLIGEGILEAFRISDGKAYKVIRE